MLLLSPLASLSPNCPEGWTWLANQDLGCLLFNVSSPVNWHEADKFCQRTHGAHLIETTRNVTLIQTTEWGHFFFINLSNDSVSEYEALVESLLVFENFIGMKEWWTSATDEVPPFSQ